LRALKLLSIPTSFIRSTIERFQSNFSAFLAANPSITAAISTIGGGGFGALGMGAAAGAGAAAAVG
jgi:uncharacterized membrane protein